MHLKVGYNRPLRSCTRAKERKSTLYVFVCVVQGKVFAGYNCQLFSVCSPLGEHAAL